MINIKQCTCKSAYQDRMYGKGMRVHTPKVLVTGKTPQYRCTVCGMERS